MWTLRVEARRERQVGAGWYVVGTARDQPRMTWGPFPTEAAAQACYRQLIAQHCTTSA